MLRLAQLGLAFAQDLPQTDWRLAGVHEALVRCKAGVLRARRPSSSIGATPTRGLEMVTQPKLRKLGDAGCRLGRLPGVDAGYMPLAGLVCSSTNWAWFAGIAILHACC